MIGTFPTRAPKEHLYRLSYGPNALALRPWRTISAGTPMSGRWDDPEGEFRVLYTSATARGALREALQYFRPASALLVRLQALECTSYGEIGVIPASWLATRMLSEIRVANAKCVPVCTEPALDAVYRQCGIRFSAGDLLAQSGLAWTRYISRMIWRKRIYSGIEAPSKYGIDLRNYAFFEDRPHSNILRAKLEVTQVYQLTSGVHALLEVAESLGLRLEQPAVSLLLAA